MLGVKQSICFSGKEEFKGLKGLDWQGMKEHGIQVEQSTLEECIIMLALNIYIVYMY